MSRAEKHSLCQRLFGALILWPHQLQTSGGKYILDPQTFDIFHIGDILFFYQK